MSRLAATFLPASPGSVALLGSVVSPGLVTLLGIVVLLGCVACDREETVEERILGAWKNGDGNIIRFEEGEKAAVGQEGLEGEGPCSYEIRGDTVAVTMLPGDASDATVVYNLRLHGDTLRILTLARHEGGASMRLTAEEYAEQVGRPLYKLEFLRMEASK